MSNFLQRFAVFAFLCLVTGRTFAQGEMVLHFPFDNTVEDKSQFSHMAFPQGNISYVEDRFGRPCKAIYLNGVDAFLEVPSSRQLDRIQTQYTLTTWFKIEDNGDGYRWLSLACKGDQPTETDNNPQFRTQLLQTPTQSTVSLNTEFTEFDTDFQNHPFMYGRWMFVAMVYDGNEVKTYINGRKVWSFPYSGKMNKNQAPLHIGKDIPGALEFFKGALDDFRIFNYALDDQQIMGFYRERPVVQTTNEVAFQCPSNIEAPMTTGQCGAVVNYTTPNHTNACENGNIQLIEGWPSGHFFPVGNTKVTYQLTTSSKQETCSFEVSIKDPVKPEIVCPLDTVYTVTTDNINIPLDPPLAKDNCQLQSTIRVSPISPNITSLGRHTITYQATDFSGNSATCSHTVTVKKQTQPVVSASTFQCPTDIRKVTDNGQCGAVVHYLTPAQKQEMAQGKLVLLGGKKSGELFPLGVTKVAIQQPATNKICSFDVTVEDKEKPQIDCPNDTTVTVSSDVFSIPLNTPKAWDNCQLASVNQLSPSTNAIASLGPHAIQYQAVDKAGNTNTCAYTMTVESGTPPAKPDVVKYKHDFTFDSEYLTLAIYDNREEDGDTISIFFNDKEIIHRTMIRKKQNGKIIRVIKLDPKIKNSLVIKAWNMGSKGKNTIQLDIYAGDCTDKNGELKSQRRMLKTKVLESEPGLSSAIWLTLGR